MNLAARIGTMAANGTNIKTIVYDGGVITNTAQFKEWAVEKLGSEHWFLIAKSLVSPNTYNQIHGGMLDYESQCLRYRNGFSNNGAFWNPQYDAFVSVGDEFYCIPNPQYADGGGGGVLNA